MINIHIVIDGKTITLTLQKDSTFLDLVMAVRAECQARNLSLPAHYYTKLGNQHTSFTLGHLGLSLQQMGIHNDAILQTGFDSRLTGSNQDLTIQNLRSRIVDIILGSLAKEITEYRTECLLHPLSPPEPNTPQTCALLALAYQYQLISAEKAQDMISALQSRYADQIIPVNSQEHVIYTMLNLMLSPAGQLPIAEPAEEKPESTADKKDPSIAKVFADLPSVLKEMIRDDVPPCSEADVFEHLPLGLQNITRDYVEGFDQWICNTDIDLSMFRTYYNQRTQPLYHLYQQGLPENWDELTENKKTIFLKQHLPEDEILLRLGLYLSGVKQNLNQLLSDSTKSLKLIWYLQLALDLGADVNHKNEEGWPVLMQAINSCNLIAVKIFLAQPGIDVNCSKDNLSALMLASSYGYFSIVELLLTHPGIQIDRMDHFHNTALIYAAQRSFNDNENLILKMLLTHGADENHTNKAGDSALIFASSSNRAARVEILLKHGVNVDHANDDGETALIRACSCGHLTIVPILLTYGADLNHVNHAGDTALKILKRACHVGDAYHQTIILLEKEAKTRRRSMMGRLTSGFSELNRSLPKLLQTQAKHNDDKHPTKKKEFNIELSKIEI
ncbi:MAG TPA: ankyrin repeat domain-containing protein [Gammaproteobacteria bacterium]|nr:ankyrin repeat domain-containing protein [Gammaproteobacteria bacterium]